MSTSGPMASNAALPTSPAVSGSATSSARVARLAKISSRRAGRSWAVVCAVQREVPGAEQQPENGQVDRGCDERRDPDRDAES